MLRDPTYGVAYEGFDLKDVKEGSVIEVRDPVLEGEAEAAAAEARSLQADHNVGPASYFTVDAASAFDFKRDRKKDREDVVDDVLSILLPVPLEIERARGVDGEVARRADVVVRLQRPSLRGGGFRFSLEHGIANFDHGPFLDVFQIEPLVRDSVRRVAEHEHVRRELQPRGELARLGRVERCGRRRRRKRTGSVGRSLGLEIAQIHPRDDRRG